MSSALLAAPATPELAVFIRQFTMKDNVSDFYGLDMLMITACFGFQEIKTLPTFVFEFAFCGGRPCSCLHTAIGR